MSTNTLDLSDLSSEPVESNVQVEISDAPEEVPEEVASEAEEAPDETEETEEAEKPATSEAEEPVATEEPVEAPEEVAEPVEAPSAPSTEEVVETVQTILTTDSPATNVATKTTEERLNALIELLKSTVHEVEYDDNEYGWTGPLLDIREALNEL